MKKKFVWIIGFFVIVALMSLNFVISPKNGVESCIDLGFYNVSVQAFGRCCPEYGSICFLPDIVWNNSYYCVGPICQLTI